MESLRILPHIESGQTPKRPSRKEVLKSRVYAFAIDLYAIVFLARVSSLMWGYFISKHLSRIDMSNYQAYRLLVVGNINLTMPIFFTSYFFFFYYLNNGRTLGKMLMKLKVCALHDHKRELTFLEAFGRSIGYLFINYLSYVPFAINYFRKDTKGIQDFISQTIVLRHDEIAAIEANEEHTTVSAQADLPFPEDPVSHRISKTS